MPNEAKQIVIIGNGIAGITAARNIRKLSNHRILVVSDETDFFYSRTALMYIYLGHMKFEHTKPYEDWFWEKNKIDLLRTYVEKVDCIKKHLECRNGEVINYDFLIIASGSVSNSFNWPGRDAIGVSGLYSIQDLEYIELHTGNIERAVIVGGGLIGIELAEMFDSRDINTTLLVREDGYWRNVLPKEEASIINREIRDHGIDLKLNTELTEILKNDEGKVSGVLTSKGDKINCQFVGLTVGVRPNIAFLEHSGIHTNRGVLVNEYFETNIPDVYAIGDCAERKNVIANRKQIEQVWYTGRIHGETVARSICGIKSAYDPGLWFNSAKFFSVEYQTYGWVNNELQANHDQYYWESKSGKHTLKIIYDKETLRVTGLIALGIRLRQEICEHWINSGATISNVLSSIEQANFDPEFVHHIPKKLSQ